MKIIDTSFADHYCNMYGCENSTDDRVSLKKDLFLQKIRSNAYKKLSKGKGGLTQWLHITGVRSKDSRGKKIYLNDRSLKYLERIVSYYQSTEGKADLLDVGMVYPPQDVDDIIDWIQGASNDRGMKRRLFNYFLRNIKDIL